MSDMPNKKGDPAPLLVSGLFYPDKLEDRELSFDIWGCTAEPVDKKTSAFILPHASWYVCGEILAAVFGSLRNRRFRRIVLTATVHGNPSAGHYLPPFDHYPCEPGIVELDAEAVQVLENFPALIRRDPDVFEEETSFETIIPFISRFLPDTRIVPLLSGSNSRESSLQLTKLLKAVYNPERDLLLILTNLCTPGEKSSIINQCENLLSLLSRSDAETLEEAGLRGAITPCGLTPLSAGIRIYPSSGLAIEPLRQKTASVNTPGMIKYIRYGSFALKG
jgi:AmmeMemoRadiSam system protein B